MILHRKAGKTALALNRLIHQAVSNPKKVFWYVAPTYKQAKEIVWRDPDMLQKYLPMEVVDKKNDTELTVYFKNGSVLGIKGADEPDSLRGPNPMGVVLDEYELMKKSVWEEIISPIVFSNPDSWCWFIGTPKPQGGHFKKLHDAAAHKDNWYALTLTVDDTKLIADAVLQEARSTMTQVAYEQEYLCKWFDDGGVVFRGVNSIVQGIYKEPTEPRIYQWGVDLARLVDWTVICGINRETHTLEFFDRFNQIDWNLQKARIEAAWNRHDRKKGLINLDATGLGDPILDDLRMRGLNVEGIKFTEETKRALITELAIGIEQRKLLIPNIPVLIEELQMFGYEILPSGRVRYGAPEGFHDDCVIALALAWWQIGSKFSGIPTEFFGKFEAQIAEQNKQHKTQGDYE